MSSLLKSAQSGNDQGNETNAPDMRLTDEFWNCLLAVVKPAWTMEAVQ